MAFKKHTPGVIFVVPWKKQPLDVTTQISHWSITYVIQVHVLRISRARPWRCRVQVLWLEESAQYILLLLRGEHLLLPEQQYGKSTTRFRYHCCSHHSEWFPNGKFARCLRLELLLREFYSSNTALLLLTVSHGRGNEARIPEASVAAHRLSPAISVTWLMADPYFGWELSCYGNANMQPSDSNLIRFFNHGSCPLFHCLWNTLKRHMQLDE